MNLCHLLEIAYIYKTKPTKSIIEGQQGGIQ